MQISTIFNLAFQNLKTHKTRVFLTIFAISIGMTMLFFFLSFSAGIKKAVYTEINKNIQTNQLIVSYDFKNVGIFQLQENKGLRFDQAFMDEIRRIKGVKSVSPQLSLKIPTMLQVDFLDKYFETDIPVFGRDFKTLKIAEDLSQDYLPVVVSEKLLDLYNTSLSESMELPRLSEEGMLGRDLDLIVGKSSFFNFKTDKTLRFPAKIVAFSNAVPLMGITIPLAETEKILENFQDSSSQNLKYSTLFVETEDVSLNQKIQVQIEKKGVKVVSAETMFQEISQNIWYFEKMIQVLGGLIFFVAMFALSNTLFMTILERRKEFGILRALGAQKKTIASLVVCEAMLMGIFSFLFGILLAFISSLLIDTYLLSLIPDVSFKPSSFFAYSFMTISFVFFFSFIFVLLSAFFPARYASSLDPLKAILK